MREGRNEHGGFGAVADSIAAESAPALRRTALTDANIVALAGRSQRR